MARPPHPWVDPQTVESTISERAAQPRSLQREAEQAEVGSGPLSAGEWGRRRGARPHGGLPLSLERREVPTPAAAWRDLETRCSGKRPDPETGSESLTGPRFLSGKRKVLERVGVTAAHSVTA